MVEVLKCLASCDVTVGLLQDTKVGRLVNSLKRHLSPDGAALAKQTVDRWKQLVAGATASPPPPHPPPPPSGPSSSDRKRPRPSSSSSQPSPPPPPPPPSRSPSLLFPNHPQPLYSLADLPRPLSPSPASPISRSSSSPSALSSDQSVSLSADSPLPLYNPNLHHFPVPRASPPAPSSSAVAVVSTPTGDEDDPSSAAAEEYVGDVTSRKRTQAVGDEVDGEDMEGGPWGAGGTSTSAFTSSASAPPPPTCPVLVCSLVQMCVDRLSHPTSLSSLRSLGAIPVPLALSILSRATAEQLSRIEQFNPNLLEDTDCLWKGLTLKHWGGGESSAEAALESQRAAMTEGIGGWRALYFQKKAEKDDRIAALGEKMKRRGEEAKKEKKEKGIKPLNLQQATRTMQQQGQRRRGGGGGEGGQQLQSGGGGMGRPGEVGMRSRGSTPSKAAAVNRLSQLRKETSGVSKMFWTSRPQ